MVCSLALVSHAARAQIAAEIPPDCGDASVSAELGRELRERLPASAQGEPVTVTITREAAGYQLVVLAEGQRRELHDRECAALLRAAVVVALAIVAPEAQTSSTTVRTGPPSAPPPKKKDSGYRIAIGADAGAQFGTTPKPAVLLGVAGQLAGRRFGLALGLRYLFSTTTLDSTEHGVRASAVGASLAGTYAPWSWARAEAGFAAYRLAGRGQGSVRDSNDSAWDGGPLLGVHFLPFTSPPFWTAVAAEGQWNLARAQFSIHEAAGNREVFRAAALSASTFLQAGVVW